MVQSLKQDLERVESGLVVITVVMAVMIIVMTRNTHLKAQNECIIRLVKYDEVDRGKSSAASKLIKMLSKS